MTLPESLVLGKSHFNVSKMIVLVSSCSRKSSKGLERKKAQTELSLRKLLKTSGENRAFNFHGEENARTCLSYRSVNLREISGPALVSTNC